MHQAGFTQKASGTICTYCITMEVIAGGCATRRLSHMLPMTFENEMKEKSVLSHNQVCGETFCVGIT